ncbi:MAG: 50S ribosomal protein L23 [Gammaproteobacteria bacterium]|nr:50S ribosomal protein L23 [Gammaproteobacteria bacterium]NIR83387.1 50S ribosomal protein L23 [Gammaproteobacteria bacterium]
MNEERLMKILLAPHVSEKSTLAGDERGQIIFKVAADAAKPEVKAAVEKMFEVKVERVRICNVKGKRKSFGGVSGRRSGWKKAYVKLAPGHDIDFLGAE